MGQAHRHTHDTQLAMNNNDSRGQLSILYYIVRTTATATYHCHCHWHWHWQSPPPVELITLPRPSVSRHNARQPTKQPCAALSRRPSSGVSCCSAASALSWPPSLLLVPPLVRSIAPNRAIAQRGVPAGRLRAALCKLLRSPRHGRLTVSICRRRNLQYRLQKG